MNSRERIVALAHILFHWPEDHKYGVCFGSDLILTTGVPGRPVTPSPAEVVTYSAAEIVHVAGIGPFGHATCWDSYFHACWRSDWRMVRGVLGYRMNPAQHALTLLARLHNAPSFAGTTMALEIRRAQNDQGAKLAAMTAAKVLGAM